MNATQRAAAALTAYAPRLPEAHEEFPWGEIAIKVRNKVFVFIGSPGEGFSVGVKLPNSANAALAHAFAEPTGYGLGKHGWVTATFGPKDAPPFELLREWIDESYRAVAPKSLHPGAFTRKPLVALRATSRGRTSPKG